MFARGSCLQSSHFYVGWVSRQATAKEAPIPDDAILGRVGATLQELHQLRSQPPQPRPVHVLLDVKTCTPRREVGNQPCQVPGIGCLWPIVAGLVELEHEAPLRPRLVRAEPSSPARLRQWTLDADPTPLPLAW